MSSSTHDLKNDLIKVSSDGNTFAHANRAKVVSVAVVRDKKTFLWPVTIKPQSQSMISEASLAYLREAS
jgi:hypothetical protein